MEVIQLLNAKIAASQLGQSEVCQDGQYDAVKDAGNLQAACKGYKSQLGIFLQIFLLSPPERGAKALEELNKQTNEEI